jgi:hypothetical protein
MQVPQLEARPTEARPFRERGNRARRRGLRNVARNPLADLTTDDAEWASDRPDVSYTGWRSIPSPVAAGAPR